MQPFAPFKERLVLHRMASEGPFGHADKTAVRPSLAKSIARIRRRVAVCFGLSLAVAMLFVVLGGTH